MIVYCIRNNLNNKVYVGRTITSFEQRYPNGKWWHYTHNKYLKRAVNKYGTDQFEVSILFTTNDESELRKAETFWITRLEATNRAKGYNDLVADISYEKANKTKRGWSQERKELAFNVKSKAQSAAWKAKTSEEMAAINAKRSATVKSKVNVDNYAARVAKRLNRLPDEIELSEVKRILDRFGSSWSPGARSKWHGNMDKFHTLAATLTTLEKRLPIVIIVGGQCGVGKSWVCKQLLNCVYISYDKARESSYQLIEAAIRDGKVVVFETPIRSKTHAKRLSEKYQVYYTVVTADEETVAARLVGRGSTRLNNVAKMNVKYKKYANVAWFAGSSCWMLTQLQGLIDSVGPVSSTTSQV